LLLVTSPGCSGVPRRSVVEVTLISCLQDQASSWSAGDLLLLSVPEVIREICGLWTPSVMLAGELAAVPSGHRNAKSRQPGGEWGSGGWDLPCSEMLESCR